MQSADRSPVETARRSSAVLSSARSVSSLLSSTPDWARSSAAFELLRDVDVPGEESYEHSNARAILEYLRSVGRSSYLYRWFTAEPDPEVVVIDLRDTIVLGAMLALIDEFVHWLVATEFGSRLRDAKRRTVEFVDDAPLRAAGILALSAIVVNVSVTILTGSLTSGGLAVDLGLVLFAVIAIRSNSSLDEFLEFRIVRLLLALFSPPRPPDGASDSIDDQDSPDTTEPMRE